MSYFCLAGEVASAEFTRRTKSAVGNCHTLDAIPPLPRPCDPGSCLFSRRDRQARRDVVIWCPVKKPTSGLWSSARLRQVSLRPLREPLILPHATKKSLTPDQVRGDDKGMGDKGYGCFLGVGW